MGVKLGNGKWAIKEDKLLAYNDNSGRFFNKEFDFSRGSSATYVAKDGLIKNTTGDIPRIDFTDTSKGALLLEPQRTNLLPYSEDFSQSIWLRNDAIIEGGYTAPDGNNTAYKVTENGSNGHLVMLSSVVSSFSPFLNTSTDKHKSIWARTVSGTGAVQLLNHNSDTSNIFTLTTQWKRFDLAHAGLSNFYAVDFRGASTTLSEIIIWGAQLEEQSFPTSYIPTYGSIATRNADVCNNSGSAQDFNSEEGVLYCEIAALADDGSSRAISLSDGTSINQIVMRYYSTSNSVAVFIRVGGTFYASLNATLTLTSFNKIAFKFKQNDFSLWINGNEVSTDTSGNTYTPNTLNELSFDRGDGADDFYGKVRNVQVFTEALTDEQLQKLTS